MHKKEEANGWTDQYYLCVQLVSALGPYSTPIFKVFKHPACDQTKGENMTILIWKSNIVDAFILFVWTKGSLVAKRLQNPLFNHEIFKPGKQAISG